MGAYTARWVLGFALLVGGCGDAWTPLVDAPTEGSGSTNPGTSPTDTGNGTGADADAPDESGPGRDESPMPEVPPPDLGSGEVPPPMPPQFVDVTVAAGLDIDPGQLLIPPFCQLDNIDSDPADLGDYCLPERLTGAAAVADYDEDGWPDVYLTRMDGPDLLLRNGGDGTFVDVAAEAGFDPPHLTGGVAWLDIEGDGDLDLMLTAIGETRHYLYVNDGRGRFEEQGQARGVALETGLVRVGMSIAVGDYDLDGYLDLFLTDWRSSVALGEPVDHNRLLHNLGAAAPGFFEDVTALVGIELQSVSDAVGAPAGAWGFSPAFVDLDGDHYPELALASDFGTSRLYWNDGAGGFEDGTVAAGVGLDANGMGSTFGDYDRDGDLDWFVTAIWSPDFSTLGNRLYENTGNRFFIDATDARGVRDGGWGWGAAFFDGDLDGDLDLAMTGGWPGTVFSDDPVRYWLDGAGEGPWLEVAQDRGLHFARNGRGLVPLDYDRDGDLDLLVVANVEIPALFRNDASGGSWLEVRVEGPPGNPQGIGVEVRVQVAPDAPVQLRHIGVGSHFLGQAEAAAYFGLGPGRAPVHRMEVLWPSSGQTRVLEDVARDQVLQVTP
jgi:enediyne biosynthesis protein E4